MLKSRGRPVFYSLPPMRSLLPRFSRRDIAEGALIAGAFLAYFWVRGAVVDDPERAYWHARSIIDVQRALGIFVEGDMNRWVTGARPKSLARCLCSLSAEFRCPARR
jgi:hypothetical protein